MPDNNEGNITFENARIVFRNFAGKEDMYNAEGDRNFCVLLDEDLAKVLDEDGWNVKALRAREEGDPDQPYLQVSVKYRGRGGVELRPPHVVMITSRGRTDLSEEEMELLDWADILKVDLIVRPYAWVMQEGTPNEKRGIKAYLKTMFVTIAEDELEMKYAEMDLPSRGGRTDD